MANKSGIQEKGKATWTDHNVDVFCDLCIKEIEKGTRPGTHLTTKGYENLGINFAKKTGLQYTKSQFKNKWDLLRDQWKLWKELIRKETGLGWNPKLKTVDAPDEWWCSKIQDNPKYAKLRKKGINPDLEEKLDMMFQQVTASGVHAWAPSSGVLPHDDIEVNNVAVPLDSDDDLACPIEVIAGSLGKRKMTPTKQVNAGTEKNNKAKGIGSRKIGGATKLSIQIDRMVESIQSRSTVTSVMNKGVLGTSIAEVMKSVSSLPGAEPGSPFVVFCNSLSVKKRERCLSL
ncbi:L10-interacting MYB domain-containing protein-like [Rosa sericea]